MFMQDQMFKGELKVTYADGTEEIVSFDDQLLGGVLNFAKIAEVLGLKGIVKSEVSAKYEKVEEKIEEESK